MTGASVLSRSTVYTSPWFVVLAREVRLPGDAAPQTFLSVKPPDYVTVLALTRDGRVPLVRQYRPAVEAYTIELPSGHIDGPESAEAAARRELLEETGCGGGVFRPLPPLVSDAGRLENRLWAFVARDVTPAPHGALEAGIEPFFATPAEVHAMVRDGRLNNALHVAVLGHALLNGERVVP